MVAETATNNVAQGAMRFTTVRPNMSTLEEKLEQPSSVVGGRATASLGQLLKRWRVSDNTGAQIDTKVPPELILVRTMGTETWKRCSPPNGLKTSYELLEWRNS